MSHKTWFTLWSLLIVVALLLSTVQPAMAQEDPVAPEPPTPRFDAPPYGLRGPHAVGVRDFVIEGKEGERPIPISVWYPALNPDNQPEIVTYMLDFNNPNFPDFAIGGRALRDAQPNVGGGPYPLVVYSHGLTLFRQISSYLAEHLASWGFVVIAGDHEDNWGVIMGDPQRDNFVVRPQEITRQIDFAETLGARDGELAGLIDLEHVGVTGHSFGAETALLAGGARLNTNMFLNEWCATNPADALSDCTTVPALLDQMVEQAGLEAVPETVWPDWSDPRVDAIVPLAPGPQFFGPEGLAAVHVPILLVESEADWYAGASNAAYAPYTLLSAVPKAHLVFEDGDHALYLNGCDAMPALIQQGLGSFCTDPVWDMDRAHDLINHFATAFFLAELKGDAEAAAALAPENVAFPGIQYETTAYVAAPAAETEIPGATSGFVDNNGVKIYYEVEGQGAPLVLAHWATGSTQDWRIFGYVDALKDDYRLILVDLRGHGRSDKPHDPAAYDAATQASDITAVLDELGIGQANYFGYSLGARLGWALAKYAPERLQSLIIGGHIPYVWDDSEWAANMLAAGPEGWANGLVSFAEALGVRHPDLYAAYAANDLEAVALASKGLNSEDLAGDLPGTQTPILLLAGTNDEFYPEMERATQDLPNATMATMPELDHGQGFMLIDQALPFITEFLVKVNPAAEAPAFALDADTATKIDTMVEETMARINLPGFALAVVKDGEVAYAKGFGVTSLDSGEPVTSKTIFQWAESTMALTAMAVLQLVEEGKLDLDAPVTDYVPYFKLADERYKSITVGQLLAHTSGIPDSGDAMADWENFLPQYDGGALERWIRRDLAQKGLLFAPGAGWEYSDLAYALLGAVIGAASGQPYEEYMQEHILAPLDMDQSTFLLEEVDKTLLASPHVPDAAGEVVVSEVMPYHRPFAATNNLFGSVEDMAKLAQASLNRGALGDQRVLPESAYEAMWTATSATPLAGYAFGRVHPSNIMIDWGNGWFLGDVAGHLAPNSYGGEHGFNAHMLFVPDANLAVVAVGNGQAMDEFYAPDLAIDVAGMLLKGVEAR